MAQKVVVLGGGIAGLSAAHELVERGFDVEVYEALSIPGGKARSIPVPGSGTPGPNGMRKDLPGEHGFRFFPRFYSHVTDTMKRIPFGTDRTVFDNLVDTTRVQLARFDRPPIELICRSPRALGDVRVLLGDLGLLYRGELELSHDEIAFFASRIWQIVTSCSERRLNEYEKIGWWEFIGAAERSAGYQEPCWGTGSPGPWSRPRRSSPAPRPSATSSCSSCSISSSRGRAAIGCSTDLLMTCGSCRGSSTWSRGVCATTSTRGSRGSPARKGAFKTSSCSGNQTLQRVAGDYYVCALPVEDLVPLLTPSMLSADPSLANLRQLEQATSWMNGIQIFLTEDVDLTHGHTIYVDSPWALTSVSQTQFWNGIDLSQYGQAAA